MSYPDFSKVPVETYLWLAAFAVLIVLSVASLVGTYFKKKLSRLRLCAQEGDLRRAAALQEAFQTMHQKELELVQLKTQIESRDEQLEHLRAQLQSVSEDKARILQLQARQEEQVKHRDEQVKLLEETRLRLFKEFELSANKLFEAKSSQFSNDSRVGLEQLLKPFRDQLREFHRRVDDVYHKENSERNQLLGQIVELQKQAQQVGLEANNLATALKGDNKAQGSWGEIILERLLEQSGLQRGREYETQKMHTDDAGKRFKPDVIVHLPEGRDIVIDSKVSLVAFQRYSEADTESVSQLCLKSHTDSIRAHIRGLAGKRYDQLEGVRTLDFVFMFIPIEAAYQAAIQASPGLFQEAYEKNIVLVGPGSLMVALRTVETLWRYARQNSNAETIAASAGKLYDQFVIVAEALEEHGRQLEKSCESFQLMRKRLTEGRGNVIRRVELLRELGAKTSRTMPDKLALDAAVECEGSEESAYDDAQLFS